jgi:hypothetical protein
MRPRIALFITLALLSINAGCNSRYEYNDPKEFLRSFVGVLEAGDESHYEDFYLRSSDYDFDAPGGRQWAKRMTGTIRHEFWSSCRFAHDLLKGKDTVIQDIVLKEGKQPATRFLKDVRNHYADVEVRLLAGKENVRLKITELIKIENSWRITQFMTIVEGEVVRVPDRRIDIEDEVETRVGETGEVLPEPVRGREPKRNFESEIEFVKEFIQNLRIGGENRYEFFYIRKEDFDPRQPDYKKVSTRILGEAYQDYLLACRKAHDIFQGKQVVLLGGQSTEDTERASDILRGAEKSILGVLVDLQVGGEKYTLEMGELLKLGDGWRVTLFDISRPENR